MINYSILNVLSEKFYIQNFDLFIINLILAIIILAIGIFLGKFIKYGLKRLIERSGIERTTRKSFIDLLLNVAKWSIYLLFISLALDQLGIPQLTSWLTSILVVIPALVGALLLIVIGFGIAIYLRDLVEESQILEWEILSKTLFYFVFYVFLIFALKTALINQNKQTVDILIIIITTIVGISVAFSHMQEAKGKK